MTELRPGTMRRFLRRKTGLRVSKMSAEFLALQLEEYGGKISELAIQNALHRGQITVQDVDIELAIEQLNSME